jgi:hypothetical protein
VPVTRRSHELLTYILRADGAVGTAMAAVAGLAIKSSSATSIPSADGHSILHSCEGGRCATRNIDTRPFGAVE